MLKIGKKIVLRAEIFSCSDSDDMINEDLADRSRYFKETEEWKMCYVMEEMRTEKERETRLDDIRNLMETLKLSVEQAMDALRIPLGDRYMYKDKLCAK